jgi:Ser/Thr protein kinase RdoA (MazF antagonist)
MRAMRNIALNHDAEAPVDIASEPGLVIERYPLVLAGANAVQALGNAGGWSGSRLWRIAAADGNSYCLRRWPVEHPTAERLRFIHEVLLHVGARLPVVSQPLRTNRDETFVRFQEHFWELNRWMPGKPASETPVSLSRVRAAMRTLAQFHSLAAEFKSDFGPASAISDRLRLFDATKRGQLEAIEHAMGTPLDAELDARCRKLLSAVKALLARDSLVTALSQTGSLLLIPAIRDIHREHVLFKGDEVTGVIDFGALRLDTPLTDIARLLGSLVGDENEARICGLEAYAEVRPLSDKEGRLVQILDDSGLAGAALNWLLWLYLDRRSMGPIGMIAQRLEGIQRRLELRLH